jgi:hypothetical protein
MNAYISSSIARDHVESLVATAAASRRAKEARLARRVARASRRSGGSLRQASNYFR